MLLMNLMSDILKFLIYSQILNKRKIPNTILCMLSLSQNQLYLAALQVKNCLRL